MLCEDMLEQIADVRAHAEYLMAQTGADAMLAAPLFAAITTLEASIHRTHASVQQRAVSTVPQVHVWPADETHGSYTDDLYQAEVDVLPYRQLLHEIPMGICVLEGPEYRYTFTNPAYDRFVGRTHVVGKRLCDVFPELDGQGIYELLDRVYTTGEPFVTSEMMVQLDRNDDSVVEEVYFDLTYQPLWDHNGYVIGVVNYVIDISDRHSLEQERARVFQFVQEAHQAAEAERQHLLDVLRQAPAAIYTTEGPEHLFTFTNARYDQLLGRHDLVGQAAHAILLEHEGPDVFALLDEVYATGRPIHGREIPIHRDQHDTSEESFLHFVYAPLYDTHKNPIGIFAHAVDVTELVAARQRAETAVALRNQFLSIAAHELKTPLTALYGATQLIQRRLQRLSNDDALTERALVMAETQSQRLVRLVDTLLDVAHIDAGHLTLVCAPLDLGTLTGQVIDAMQLTLEQCNIQTTLPAEPCVVMGDRLRLEQVIVNLVQNAIKYSPAGSAIQVSVGSNTAQIWFCISDHGIGIPHEALPHVFQRFYRVAKKPGHAVDGLGIGLSIVHEIVTLHGGSMTVTSTEGYGSTFTAWFPQAEAQTQQCHV